MQAIALRVLVLTASFAALLFQNHLDRDSSLEFRGFVQLSWVSAVHYVTCWVEGNGNIGIALNLSCFTKFQKVLTQAFLHHFLHLYEITNHRNHDISFISLNIRHLLEDENQTKWSWYGMILLRVSVSVTAHAALQNFGDSQDLSTILT